MIIRVWFSTYLFQTNLIFSGKMQSDRLLQFLSAQNNYGDNYFHEACRTSSMDLVKRAAASLDYPIPAILAQRNLNGEQCTHVIVKNQKDYSVEMMQIVVDLGADINDKEKQWLHSAPPVCQEEKLSTSQMAFRSTTH